jgi:hypothetical protein
MNWTEGDQLLDSRAMISGIGVFADIVCVKSRLGGTGCGKYHISSKTSAYWISVVSGNRRWLPQCIEKRHSTGPWTYSKCSSTKIPCGFADGQNYCELQRHPQRVRGPQSPGHDCKNQVMHIYRYVNDLASETLFILFF